MDYYKAFKDQRAKAIKERGIEWHFTFDEWLDWWGDDIVNRGREKGKLVMARYNDTGPYHPDNVKKITVSENAREGHTHSPRDLRKPFVAEGKEYPSLNEAAKSYNITYQALQFRMRKAPDVYFYKENK